jgi:hypothetical protein
MPALHADYAAIAKAHIAEFVDKKNEERQALVETVAEKIRVHSEKEGLPLPQNLNHVCSTITLMCLLTTPPSQKVQNWFHNHRPHNPKKTTASKKSENALINWTVRRVVQQTRKDEIKDRMKGPGISSYHEACTAVIDGLTEAEKKQCETQAEEWNATGPDPLIQAQ